MGVCGEAEKPHKKSKNNIKDDQGMSGIIEGSQKDNIKSRKNNKNHSQKNDDNEKEAKYEKDYEEKIKILEKTKKPIFYIEKKNSIENNSKRLKMKSERRKIKNKNFAKNEFNDLIKYDDDV